MTGYGTQGDTVDIGMAVLERSTRRNHAYVAMTRGRHANHALLLDANGSDDPADRLAEIIARPATAESALAVRRRLHREAGVELPDDEGHSPSREKPSPRPHPRSSMVTKPTLDDEVRATRARLDRVARRQADDRSLGL